MYWEYCSAWSKLCRMWWSSPPDVWGANERSVRKVVWRLSRRCTRGNLHQMLNVWLNVIALAVMIVATNDSNIEHESPDFIPDKYPAPGTWRSKGTTILSDRIMSVWGTAMYPWCWRDVLRCGEWRKIGVIGRKDSGKSSLIIALFRISVIEKNTTESG